jgi:hypothetical protein
MLFDLQGKRRRVVQATYLVLAILMGGGLVLFGIGGDVSGGLFDAVSGNNSGNGNGNSIVAKRIKADEKAVQLNPKNTPALARLVRSHYQLATDDADRNTGQFGPAGLKELEKASAAWNRYADASKKVDPSLAGLMLNAYGDIGLKKPAEAARVATLVAEARPSAASYLQVVRYAAQAGQTRIATLAGDKAIALAPKNQKKLVKQQVDAMKAQSTTAGSTGSSGG